MLQRLYNTIKSHRLPILAGFFIGTSYIPFPPWALFFAYVPLWIFWQQTRSLKQTFVAGWITQFVLTAIGFNWVTYTVHEFGHLPWPVAALVFLVFCGFANLYIPLSGLLWRWLNNKLRLPTSTGLLLLPPMMALGEVAMPTLFSWNFGYPWIWAQLPGYHLAEFVGFRGLSALTLAINFLLMLAWQNRRRRQAATVFVAAVLMFVLANGLGWLTGRSVIPPDSEARVMIVQANIGNLEKQYAEKGWGFRQHIIKKYLALAKQGLESAEVQPDFMVWPETAFPDLLNGQHQHSINARMLRDFLRDNKVSLITGGYGRIESTGQSTNSMYLLDQFGNFADKRYNKTILLAFGEYFPGAKYFPQLKKLVPEVADFAAGDGPQLKTLNGLLIGPQICYESLFARFSRKLANLGAEVMVNLTNDSWYGTWQEPYQHLYMTLARAVEFRRPLVRSTNTGISTVVLASGKVLRKSPLRKQWFHIYKVPYKKGPQPTFYQQYFWLIPALLCLVILAILIWGWRNRRSSLEQDSL